MATLTGSNGRPFSNSAAVTAVTTAAASTTAADADELVIYRGGSLGRFVARTLTSKWLGGLTGEAARALYLKLADRVSVKDFGAKGDVLIATRTTSITSGANRLQIQGGTPTPAVTSAHVGMVVIVPGAGVAGADLISTITAIVNAGPVVQVDLADNASTTLTFATKVVTYGTDDTTAIQAALTVGGRTDLPPGGYMVSSTLLMSKLGELVGAGHLASYLYVKPTMTGSQDVISVVRASGEKERGWRLARFGIRTGGGTPARYGINVDVTTLYLSQFRVEDIYCDTLGSGSFRLTNPSNADGFFCSWITGCLFFGGSEGSIYLQGAGDSLQIKNNTLAGTGLGINATFMSGAARFTVEDNNITSTGGAIRLNTGLQGTIRHNQIEQAAAYVASTLATVQACITIGDVGNYSDVLINQNNLGYGSNVTYGIDLQTTSYVRIRDNTISKAGGSKHINIGATAAIIAVGDRNNWGGATPLIDVHASATRLAGFPIAFPDASLLNSWIPYDSTNHPIFYMRDEAGMVQLVGGVKSGTITAGTNILVLPTGYTPAKNLHVACACAQGATWSGVAVLLINTGGTVQIISAPASTTVIMFGNTMFKAPLA